jgi:hypothetical protein
MGAAAAPLRRPDEARSKYYRQAIEVCTELRFRPELALTGLQLAELLLEHYPDEKKEALEHLDFAIKEFQDTKMQPSLERALRHKEILKAQAFASASPGNRKPDCVFKIYFLILLFGPFSHFSGIAQNYSWKCFPGVRLI